MNPLGSGQTVPRGNIGFVEFVALMAFASSLVALSIDAMLPAFPEMARDLQVNDVNHIQWVISMLFIGMSAGQLLYGPLSDSIGRKPAIYLGFAVFIAGSLLSMVASSFALMLAGRLLQGIGAAGPRTVAIALIRDRFHGSAMARVMSFIMTIFILVPIFAPALGQLILHFSGWRTIFGAFVVLSVITLVWLGLRQPETLPPELRVPFTLHKVRFAFAEVLRHRVSMTYTVVAGLISGAFFGYLNVCQQIFQVQYALGSRFPLYFAILALSVGLASLLNSSIVMRLGMRVVADRALLALMVFSWLFLLQVWALGGQPPLWLFIVNCLAIFFCLGALFGNLNSIAMEPLGHMAGTGAAVLGSGSNLLAVSLGLVIGSAYDGTLLPMALGFVALSTVSRLLTHRVRQWVSPAS